MALDQPIFALILVKEDNQSTVPAQKHLKHRRDQLREISHMKRHTPDLVSVVRDTTR